MAAYLLDTTTLTDLQSGHPRVLANFAAHAGDTVGVSVINIEEQLGGWYALSRKARTNAQEAAASQLFAAAVGFLARFPQFPIHPLTEPILDQYDRLRKLRLNVGRNDLKIAVTALELGAIVVTNNATDFGRIPGLLWEDWTR
jgi:tRNA(fMet)-specific endonuclease VapC